MLYYKVENPKFNHYIFARFNRRVSTLSTVNFTDDLLTSYNATYLPSADTKMVLDITYIDSEDQVPNGEEYAVFRSTLSYNKQMSENLEFNASFIYTERNSDIADSDYDRTQFEFGFVFDL